MPTILRAVPKPPKPARLLVRSTLSVLLNNAIVNKLIGGDLARAIPAEFALCTPRFSKGFDDEDAARQAIAIVADRTMAGYERLVTLFNQAKYCEINEIPGDFVECGTWRGGCVGLMALANLRYGHTRRTLHLFDSFEGLPEPTADDGAMASTFARGRSGGRLVSINQCVATRQDCEELLVDRIEYDPQYIRFHVGWFQDTIPRDADGIEEIAILRIDGDWYESTRISLDYLFPKVVRNGVVVIDDYGHWPGCRKAVDDYLADHQLRYYLHHIDYTGRYLVKA